MRKPAPLSESKRLKTAPEAKILQSVPVIKAVGRVLCQDMGGLGIHCPDCRFPFCSFGKGS